MAAALIAFLMLGLIVGLGFAAIRGTFRDEDRSGQSWTATFVRRD